MAGIIILLGPTGAGKTEQGKLLAHDRGWVHLSSGELLRQSAAGNSAMQGGSLAPSEQVNSLIEQAIGSTAEEPVILDGFPRMLDEAVWLAGQLPGWHREVARVVLIEVDRPLSLTRLKARGRADDGVAAVARKWHEYETETLPVVEYYRHLGLLTMIDGRGSIAEVYKRLQLALS